MDRASSFASRTNIALGRDGATAVEFALLAPMLLLLLGGLIDCSRLLSQTMQVRAAAQAGADYARLRGADLGAVAAAVRQATPARPTASVSETRGCVEGGFVVATSGTSCAGGGPPGRFVTVVAETPFAPLLPGPHQLALPAAISAQAKVRVE